MNKRLLTVLMFALVVSGVASFVLYRVISAQLEANNQPASNRVVVAAKRLEIGALVKEEDVKLAPWSGPIPEGAVANPADAIDRGVVQAIYAGEPIVDNRLAPRGAGAGLAATIPPGMRAVAVRVNDVVGVAGFVTPGMKVDILIAGNPPQGSGGVGTLTKTLLQNVEVLSAGQNIQRDAEGKPVSVNVVNMLVTPEQAEILSLASNETRIQLVLRNPTDKDVTETAGTAIQYLFDNHGMPPVAKPAPPAAPAPRRQAAKAPPPPPPPPPEAPKPEVKPEPIKVVVFHGSRRAEATFQTENEEKAESTKQ